jgi:hypothetical protein
MCIASEYMAGSSIMTLRIDPALLTALKDKAAREKSKRLGRGGAPHQA